MIEFWFERCYTLSIELLYYYIFKFLASPTILTTTPQLSEIWEMLIISNYYTPPPLCNPPRITNLESTILKLS